MSPTVSNTPLTNYTPATLTIAGEEYQLTVASGPETSGSPTILPTTVTALSGAKVGQDVAVKESVLPADAATATAQITQAGYLLTIASAVTTDTNFSNTPVMHMGIYDNGLADYLAWDGSVRQFAGSWPVQLEDGAANDLTSSTTTPGASDRGLHVRQVGPASVEPSAIVSTTGTLTTILSSVFLKLDKCQSAVILIYGTYASFNGTFELSFDGGVNYRSVVSAVQIDANTVTTTTGPVSNLTRAYRINCNGASHIRLLRTALVSGTVNVEIYGSFFPCESVPGIQSHPVTLTSTSITSIVAGTAATNLGKAIDAVPGATDTGVAALMQRIDSPGALTPVNGDYVLPRVDSNGRQWVNVGAGTVAATQSGTWNINAITTLPAITGTVTATQAYTPITWGTPVSTVVTVAASVTAANGSRKALQVWCESGEIYYRFGANPSTTVYHGRLGTGQELRIAEGSINTQSFCALAVGATATVVVTEAT